jgi:chromosome segregation ATPase
VRGQFERHKSRWLSDIQDSFHSVKSLFTDLNRLTSERSTKEALDRAQQGDKALQADLQHLDKERMTLDKERMTLDKGLGSTKLDLADGDRLLKELQNHRGQIQSYIRDLDGILKEEADPARRQLMEKIKRVPLLEQAREYRQALALARETLEDSKKILKKPNPELSQKVKELEAVLGPKDDDHRAAQDFIYETPPKLETTEEIKEQVDKARTAFEECRKAGDHLSLRKLQSVLRQFNTALLERAKDLGKGEADREEADQIKKVDQVLRELDGEVRKYLDSKKAPSAAK